ncbi:MAG: WD domain, G-beta repeat [Methanoregulaceae archaeon PtaB.Bin152]|nr:MAG: WD domain, G-beta repeat [Methanoregulaceae archaeon PtaB.Bin152]
MPSMARMLGGISCRAPLFGRFARSSAAMQLAAAARGGDRRAVHALCRALAESPYPEVRRLARECLTSLVSHEAIDALCDRVIVDGDPCLTRIALEQGYRPRSREKQALFYFLSGQAEAWQELDPLESHPLLTEALTGALPHVRARALAAARERGMVGLCCALARRPEAGGWSPEDWGAHLEGCRRESQWDEIYALLFLAPIERVVEAVQVLRLSGWKPPEGDLLLWKDLLALAPERWEYPDPPQPASGELTGPAGRIDIAVLSPDGAHLATLSCGGTLCQWSLPKGVLLSSGRPAGGSATAIACSPDGRALAIGAGDGSIRIVEIGGGAHIRTLHAHGAPVTSVAFAPGGETLCSGGSDGSVCSWNWPDCSGEQRRSVHRGAVTAVAAHGEMIASGCRDGTAGIWRNGGQYIEIAGTGDAIRGLVFCCGGAILAGIDEKGTFRSWNSLDGTLRTLVPTTPRRFIAWCAVPGGNFAALATDDHTAVLVSLISGEVVNRLEVPGQGITSLALHPEADFIIAGCRDGSLHTWSLPEKERVQVKKAHDGMVRLLEVDRAGTRVTSAGWDGTAKLWALSSGELQTIMRGPGTPIHCLASTPGGELIACGCEGGVLTVWETGTRELVHTLNLFCGRIESLALTPSGTMAVCGDDDGRVSLWDLVTGSLRATLDGHVGGVRALAINRDGTLLASGGWDGSVRLWSLPAGEPITSLVGHESPVTSLAFSPSGPFLVSGSHDRTAIAWDLESGQMHARMKGHSHVVSCLGITGDGRVLATGSWDRTVRLWSMPSGEPLKTIPGHAGRVRSLSVHPDGSLLACAVDGGTLSLFSLPGGRLIRTRVASADARNGICLLPSLHMMAAAGRDGSLRTFGIPWTRPMCETTPADIAYVQSCITRELAPGQAGQWKFLERLLAGKFRHSIAYGGSGMPAGPYDIEIVEEPEISGVTRNGVSHHAV